MQAVGRGEKINTSEHRAVLRVALCLFVGVGFVCVDGWGVVFGVCCGFGCVFGFVCWFLGGVCVGVVGGLVVGLVCVGVGGFGLGLCVVVWVLWFCWWGVCVCFVGGFGGVGLVWVFFGFGFGVVVFG
ncbi:hypothetical protein ACTHT8_14165, partial [Neisseria sp. P0021.S004]